MSNSIKAKAWSFKLILSLKLQTISTLYFRHIWSGVVMFVFFTGGLFGIKAYSQTFQIRSWICNNLHYPEWILLYLVLLKKYGSLCILVSSSINPSNKIHQILHCIYFILAIFLPFVLIFHIFFGNFEYFNLHSAIPETNLNFAGQNHAWSTFTQQLWP